MFGTGEAHLLRKGDGDPSLAAKVQPCRRQAHQTDEGQGQQQREKIAHGQGEMGVEKQVLRVAHRGGHAAQIGGHRLKGNNRNKQIPAAHHLQHQNGEGDESDEGHIVGHQHGAEEGQQDQGERNEPYRPLSRQQPLGQHQKQSALLKPRHHGHQTKQQTQYPQVDIVHIGGGGGTKKAETRAHTKEMDSTGSRRINCHREWVDVIPRASQMFLPHNTTYACNRAGKCPRTAGVRGQRKVYFTYWMPEPCWASTSPYRALGPLVGGLGSQGVLGGDLPGGIVPAHEVHDVPALRGAARCSSPVRCHQADGCCPGTSW